MQERLHKDEAATVDFETLFGNPSPDNVPLFDPDLEKTGLKKNVQTARKRKAGEDPGEPSGSRPKY